MKRLHEALQGHCTEISRRPGLPPPWPGGNEYLHSPAPLSPRPGGHPARLNRTGISPESSPEPNRSQPRAGRPFSGNRRAAPFARVAAALTETAVYVVELSLKLSPMPVSVQRKELADAQALYGQIKAVLESGQPRVLELSCEKAEEKRVSLLSSELVAVQLYERSAAGGTGTKRPGFSVDS